MNNFFKNESKIHAEVEAKLKEKMNNGVSAHSKHIECLPHMKQYIKMYRYIELDTVIKLVSEPFDSIEDAQHFADSFSDNFLYDAKCEKVNGKYCVCTDWLLKAGMMSYSYNNKDYYFEFANWS